MLFSSLDDDSRFVIPAPSNATTVIIDNLTPNTLYAFAVRAENAAGLSPFGPETRFRTLGEAPKSPPVVSGVRNTTDGCVSIAIEPPPDVHDNVTGYNLLMHRIGDDSLRKEFIPANTIGPYSVCQLQPRSSYVLSVEAVNKFGKSPPIRQIFQTEESVPSGIPTAISLSPAVGVPTITVQWQKPSSFVGQITHYNLYYKVHGHTKWKVSYLTVTQTQQSVFRFQLTGLAPLTKYQIRLSASNRKGEGHRSDEHIAVTDVIVSTKSDKFDFAYKCERVSAPDAAEIGVLTFDCINGIELQLNLNVIDLALHSKYSAKARCLTRSTVDNQTNLYGPWGNEQEFILGNFYEDSTTCDDIPVELFYGYCEDLARNENAKFKLQFQQVELMAQSNCTEPDVLEKNLDKNRYLNIGAIESSRVRINTSSNGSDYINANYIDSCEKRNAYIATQAPLPSTFADFWEMIWQETSNVIVVITNMVEDGRRKCDQYWPSSAGSSQTHGNYQVGLVKEMPNAYFVHRILSLRVAKFVPPAERRIHQLHFKGWPDHGVPDTVFPLLTFMHYVAEIHSTGPIVVHCSAGVGRSGSFILMDSMRRHLINSRKLNLMGHLMHMRRQREKVVQTVEQYILCHETIRQLIRHGITRIHPSLFQRLHRTLGFISPRFRYINYLCEEHVNGKTRIQMQYEDLCECHHKPLCSPPRNYITLPGYHRANEFIVANWSRECPELWQLVWSQNCQTIVLLGEDDYWTGIESVENLSIQHGDNFVLLQNNEDQVNIVQFA
uniref:Protein-tyrosine-phosphatase n=1 Tax=Angiostrongylus cantonensis TaxID=6313 RepID=A0A0K0D9L1_ANGCA